MKIGIVYNPFAGGNKVRGEKRRLALRQILGNRGVMRETRSLEDLNCVAQEFYRDNIDILAISGGDGSNHCVLTAFQKLYQNRPLPVVALLRGGTMNLLEHSLQMSGSPETRLKKLVALVDAGKCPVINHTLLCVNGKFGYIFGNGVIANFLKEYYKANGGGFMQAVSLFAKAFWAGLTGQPYIKKIFAPIQAHISVDNKLLPETTFAAVMAATEKGCGLGFKPFYRVRKELGKFQFLAATNLSPMEVIQNLPRFRTGKKIHSNNFYDVVTDHVVLETFDPYYYTIDGEMLNSTKRIEISAGPVIEILAI